MRCVLLPWSMQLDGLSARIHTHSRMGLVSHHNTRQDWTPELWPHSVQSTLLPHALTLVCSAPKCAIEQAIDINIGFHSYGVAVVCVHLEDHVCVVCCRGLADTDGAVEGRDSHGRQAGDLDSGSVRALAGAICA